MGSKKTHGSEATLFFGFSLDYNCERPLEPIFWEDSLFRATGRKEYQGESCQETTDIINKQYEDMFEEFDIEEILNGDENKMITFGIRSTIFSADSSKSEEVDVAALCSVNIEEEIKKLQRFCDILDIEADIKKMYKEGECGWKIACWHPKDNVK